MRSAYLGALESRLNEAGIHPDVIDGLSAELADHLDDVVAELVADGHAESAALALACERLGDPDSIATVARGERRLGTWWRRYPGAAVVIYPLACAATLPAVPVLIGMRHAPLLGRWLSCLLAGGLVTAAIFLTLTTAVGL